MELDFLTGGDVARREVAAELAAEEKLSSRKILADITYPPERASLGVDATPGDLPYVLRAIKNAQDQGLRVERDFKKVLIDRCNGERVVSLREADILLRCQVQYDNPLVSKAIHLFGGCFAEDNPTLTDDVFALRIRYNKGLEWKRTKMKSCTEGQQKDGLERLQKIADALAQKRLPLHPEELISGVQAEFLKPEYLSQEQTDELLDAAARFRSIKEQEEKVKV